MKGLFKLGVLALATVTTLASASELTKSQVSRKLQEISKSHPEQLLVINVEQSPLQDFYQVITDKGIFYTSKDGKHLISGSILEFDQNMQNLTKDRLLVEREKEITSLKDDFITYRAPNQKHEVIVFYDTTCGYCHKLHSEIDQYLQQGITVHYAAFPRGGIASRGQSPAQNEGYLQLQDIWCADGDNKNLAFNLVSQGKNLPRKACKTSIDRQYKLGVQIGLQGTPAIISMRGDVVVAGYSPAATLKQRLEQML
jgi:thiol:disulfide interchange protein DsbC